MTDKRVIVGVAWIIVLVPVLYVSTCSIISGSRSREFESIVIGQTEQQVIDALGQPSIREKRGGVPFQRYTSYPCEAPCAERLWFENRMSFDFDAWSVDLSDEGKIIKKSRWASS